MIELTAAQAALALLFFFFLALSLISSENRKKEELLRASSLIAGAVFIASFYYYIFSLPSSFSIYPLFIVEYRGGYSVMNLDLSQIVALISLYSGVKLFKLLNTKDRSNKSPPSGKQLMK